MCSPATCRKCAKTTWSGCGMHVQEVMQSVPVAQQCTCDGPATEPTAADESPRPGVGRWFRG